MSDEEVHLEILSRKAQAPISEVHRFFLVIMGSFGCICASFVHAFNLISGDMAKLNNLTQRDLSIISVVGKVFAYSVLPYAFLYDFMGPVPITVIATVYFALGCVLMALSFSQVIHTDTVRLSVFNAILGSGTMLFDLTAVITVGSHFPTMRGATMALLKSFNGLGTAIFGSVRSGFFRSKTDHFFYFLAAFSGLVGTVYLFAMRLPPYHLTGWQERHLPMEKKQRLLERRAQYLRQKPPTWRLVVGYVIVIILIVYLPVQSSLTTYLKLGTGPKMAFAVVTVILTASMMLVFMPDPSNLLRRFRRKKNDNMDIQEPDAQEGEDVVEEVDLKAEVAMEETQGEAPETEVDYIAPQYQESFLHNLLTLRMWCLLWTLFCLTGTEYIVILNSAYIVGALDGKKVSDDLRTMLSVLSGTGSAVGRLIMASFEHWSQHRPPEKRIPFPWAPFFPMTLLIIAIVLFLTLPGIALPLPFVIVAIANGSQATLTVLIPRTIYGKDTAKHYNFCFVASIASCIALVRFLYGEWYAVQAEKSGGSDGYCYGKKCMLMPFLVLLGLLLSSILSTLYLAIKYSRFCKRVLAERRRLREQCVGTTMNMDDVEAILEKKHIDVNANVEMAEESEEEANIDNVVFEDNKDKNSKHSN